METIQSGNFTFTKTAIDGVIIVDVKSYGDARGYFMETYKKEDFVQGGIDVDFVQDNQSASVKGVLRGLHYQIHHPQSKLVRVVEGAVFDVAVDLRQGSDTYGKWVGVELTAANRRQLFIPRGFAHGFLVLSEHAVFCYKCDDVYHPNDEGGLMWNDPVIGIRWPAMKGDSCFDAQKLVLSAKDTKHNTIASLEDGVNAGQDVEFSNCLYELLKGAVRVKDKIIKDTKDYVAIIKGYRDFDISDGDYKRLYTKFYKLRIAVRGSSVAFNSEEIYKRYHNKLPAFYINDCNC